MYKISDTVMPTITETVKASKTLQEKKVNINMLYSMLGHANEAYTKKLWMEVDWSVDSL